MMEPIARRKFLARTLSAGGGAVLIQSFGPESAWSARAATMGSDQPPGFDPEFIAGPVIDIGRGGLLTILDPDSRTRPAQLSANSRVWKQGYWNRAPVAVSDCTYSRGSLDSATGILAVDQLWVDISSFTAEVAGISPGRLTVKIDGVSGPVPVGVTASTEFPDSPGKSADQALRSLTPGSSVLLVGYGPVEHGEFTATRIFRLFRAGSSAERDVEAIPAPRSRTSAAGVRAPDTLCDYYFYGLASWECCGGKNGCGSSNYAGCNPPPSSGGTCGTCRTDYQQAVWSYIIYSNGNVRCNNLCCACCQDSLPAVQCGSYVNFRNQCTGTTGGFPVSDCHCTHCTSSHCCSGGTNCYSTVRFEFTACGFTALGGSLSAGLFPCRAGPFLFPC